MPRIQLFERQQSVPSQVGGEISVTPPQSAGRFQAMQQVTNQFQSIGTKLQTAQDNRNLSSGTLAATLAFNDLETKLSKVDPQQALFDFNVEADKIFEDVFATTGFTSNASRDAFEAKFNQLRASSQIKIQGEGLKRWNQKLEGDLDLDLDALVKAAGTTSGPKRLLAIQHGEDAIDKMVASNVIAADVGARRKLKFRKEIAEAGVNEIIRTAPLADLNVLARTAGGGEEASLVLKFGGWTQDLSAHTLTAPDGRDVSLTKSEFNLLAAMAKFPGRVLSRDFLLDAVSGNNEPPSDRMIDVFVSRLRKKIETDPRKPELILTVAGLGYKFAGNLS